MYDLVDAISYISPLKHALPINNPSLNSSILFFSLALNNLLSYALGFSNSNFLLLFTKSFAFIIPFIKIMDLF